MKKVEKLISVNKTQEFIYNKEFERLKLSCGRKMWSKIAMKGIAVEVNPPKVVDLSKMTELPKRVKTPTDWNAIEEVLGLVNTVRVERNYGERYCSKADLLELGICFGYDASTGELLKGANDVGVFRPCGSANEYIENMLAFLFIGNKNKGSTPEEQYKKFQTWLVKWVDRNSHVVGVDGAWGKIPLVDATPVAKTVVPPVEEVIVDGGSASVVLPSLAQMLKSANEVFLEKKAPSWVDITKSIKNTEVLPKSITPVFHMDILEGYSIKDLLSPKCDPWGTLLTA